MVKKVVKFGVVPVVALLLVGGLLFGGDMFSYARSSVNANVAVAPSSSMPRKHPSGAKISAK